MMLDVEASRVEHMSRRVGGAQVRRRHDDVWASAGGLLSQPNTERLRLLDAQIRERDVHVPLGDVQTVDRNDSGCVVGDVAETLTVAQQPQCLQLRVH